VTRWRPIHRIDRLGFLLLALTACTVVVVPSTNPDTTAITPPSESSTTAVIPTTGVDPTTTSLADGTLVLAPSLPEMPDPWTVQLFLPYEEGPDGEEEELLGTSLGGDGEGIQIGPDYGAQGPDGTWWFLDAAKLRLAHFSPTGEFLKAVVLDPDLLSQGLYFQYQLPRVLDSGMLVANRLDNSSTAILRARSEEIDVVSVDVLFFPRVDDGRLLYGFSADDDATLLEVDPNTGIDTPTDWFRTRAGTRFRVGAGPGELHLELPDAGVDTVLTVVAGELGGPALFGIEVASGIDGTLHLFFSGVAAADESVGLSGYLTVAPDGAVGGLEPTRSPFSAADPGSPSHLGVQPGTNDPWLMFIDEDGVRIFRRA
jgi:hypothetical protein